MDLTQKSLQSLRDLALRMGINAATVYKKPQLIEKIEERKKELESGDSKAYFHRAGRPRKDNSYISIVQKADGTIDFRNGYAPIIAAIPPEPAPKEPIVKDKIIIEKLEEAADILRTLYLAIDTILENS